MPTTKAKRVKQLAIDDPAEQEWKDAARAIDERNEARFEQHEQRVARGKRAADPVYEDWPPPLPDFNAGTSEHVKGEVFGRFVVVGQASEQQLAHDTTRATAECGIDDSARARTFVHFASELRELYPDTDTCPRCWA